MINIKIESLDDLIVAFEFLIDEALILESAPNMKDIHESFETAWEEILEELENEGGGLFRPSRADEFWQKARRTE